MRHTKKFLALFCSFCLLASFFPAVSLAAGGETYAVLDSSGTLTFCVGTPEAGGVRRDAGGVVSGDRIFSDFLSLEEEDPPWHEYKNDVRTVHFADVIAPTSTAEWFFKCQNLTEVLNGGNLDTSAVTTMHGMFEECDHLASIDVSAWNTAKVTDMKRLFDNCYELKSLDVGTWVTDSVTDMSYMFSNCRTLSALDVSNFHTANVKTMRGMFSGCEVLSFADVSGFNTENVENMADMFSDSPFTSLDLTSFNTSKIEDMGWMFCDCTALSSLTLGPAFRFVIGHNSKEDYTIAALPDAPDTFPYTGYWIKVHGDGTRYTSEQLMDAYDGSDEMVGTWVWEGTVLPAVSLADAVVTSETQTYTGAALTPAVTVTLNGETLLSGTDYEISGYENNVNAGLATVTVAGINAYKDAAAGTFEILPCDLAAGKVISVTTADTGDGSAVSYGVLLENRLLTKDADYTLLIQENAEKALVTVAATGKGNYTGTAVGTFPMEKAEEEKIDISEAVVTAEDQTYTGAALTPPVTVTLNGETLTEGADYTVGFANNTAAGAAVLIIYGTGRYEGSAFGSFQIKAASEPEPPTTDFTPGDVDGNGKVEAADARYALRAAVGLDDTAAGLDFSDKTNRCYLAADVTKDEQILAEDARLILRAAVGLETLS